MDTIEGPRAPAVKLTARHSSLTRVKAAPLSPVGLVITLLPTSIISRQRERERERERELY